MPSLTFTDQGTRLRRMLNNALEDALIDVVREEEGGRLLIEAHRRAGPKVSLRFLGVRHWQATAEPEPQSPLRLLGVGTGGGLKAFLRAFIPIGHGPMTLGSRVRIEAGAARLSIDCEDAEWWQEETPQAPESNPS